MPMSDAAETAPCLIAPRMPPFELLESDAPHIEKLAPQFRQVIAEAAKGDAYLKIAETLGLPIGTVKSRIHRARTQILAAREAAKAEAA